MLTRRQAVLAGMATPVLFGLRGAPLANPFAQARIRAPDLGPQPFDCTPAPPPVMGVQGVNFYTDAQHSKIDQNLRDENNQAASPIRQFSIGIQSCAAAYIASHGANRDAAHCAGQSLLAWANASALTGQFNFNGLGHRMWNLAGFGAAYLALADGIGDVRDVRGPIGHWFEQVGQIVADRAQPWRNNLGCWAGAAASVAGVAANSRSCFNAGMTLAARGIASIADDGTMQSEVDRGSKAMNYHMFALNALLMSAEVGMANGQDLYSANGNALSRLFETVLRNVDDPQDFVKRTGVAQDWNGGMKEDISWMEVWYARFKDPRLLPYLKARRPLRDIYMGGNVSLMFGIPLPA
jgi:poly(beta-D-mannuronate) lyase